MQKIIHHLENFNLKVEDLYKNDHLFYIRAHLRYPDLKPYLEKAPKERKKLLPKKCRESLKEVVRQLTQKDYKIIGSTYDPRGIEGWFSSEDLLNMYDSKKFGSIFVEKVDGIEFQEKENPEKFGWYSVSAKYAIQIENQIKGLQTQEDRILLVRARNIEEVKSKVKQDAKVYSKPYLNIDQNLVRWKLIEIIDIEFIEHELEDDVIEVSSKLYDKRIKPKMIWKKEYKT
ncbi:MAG: DUF4288 domain-containing protein [Lentisphaeraceae bacterium]|nr:DUF4288 domain-containing protein [Lentisphaeraceae bacterium]